MIFIGCAGWLWEALARLCAIQAIASPCVAGKPKAIPLTHLTPLRMGADAFFHQDVRPGDVICWPTNMGCGGGRGVWCAARVVPVRACCDLRSAAP